MQNKLKMLIYRWNYQQKINTLILKKVKTIIVRSHMVSVKSKKIIAKTKSNSLTNCLRDDIYLIIFIFCI
jgi:hypothetical protein